MQLNTKQLEILTELTSSLDKQTYDDKLRGNFDLPDDYEYDVNITARQMRVLEHVLGLILFEAKP